MKAFLLSSRSAAGSRRGYPARRWRRRERITCLDRSVTYSRYTAYSRPCPSAAHFAEAEPEEQNTPSGSLPPAQGKGRVWQAMAMAVPSRLWLGGMLSACRDRRLTWRAGHTGAGVWAQHDGVSLRGRPE